MSDAPESSVAESLSLLRAAAEVPERIALLDGDTSWTFGDLAAPVRRAMEQLQAMGTSAPVALVADRRVETMVRLYGLLELGVPAVPLHPRWTAAEQEAQRVAVGARQFPSAIETDEGRSDPAGSGGLDLPALPPDSATAAILFTSGSSGRPKAAVLSRRAFAAAARASTPNLGWQDDDRWLLNLTPAHVGGLSVITRCLAARRTVVLDPDESFDPGRLARILVKHRVTLLSLVPTMLHRLLALCPRWQPPATLRAVLLGGATATPALLTQAADRGLPVLTTYGCTEACSQVATQPYGTTQTGELGCGPPLPGVELRLADDEIQLRGPTLLDGYLQGGALVSPLTPDGWLPTGDLGRLDETGNLHLLGRRDDMIITGGENVYPLEVEQLLESHPGVRSACITSVDDPEWGQIVVATIVPADPALTEEALDSFCRRHLAGPKRPRQWRFVDGVPTRPSGKLDRRALDRLFGKG